MNKFFIIALFSVTSTFSQVEDANLWIGAGLKANVTKDLKLAYETQTRFDQNYSSLSKYYNEFSAEYDLPLDFSIGLSYRYSRKNKQTHYEGENRLCFNLEHSIKIKPLNLKFKTRARYQYANDRFRPVNDLIFPEEKSSFRIKFNLQYEHPDFKRIKPYVSTELFKNISPQSPNSTLDGLRLTGGLEFDLPARHELNLAYIYDQEVNGKITIAHVIAFQYTYELSSKLFYDKKKKKKKN